MALEIEKKYRISDEIRTRIRAELERQGAVRIGEEFESNTIYSGGSLTDTGGVIRIRTTDSRSLLTYKRRVPSDSEMKVQIEHETEISDPASAADLLRELGLQAALVYEKRRETWRFADVEVVVDELPFGLFVEIE